MNGWSSLRATIYAYRSQLRFCLRATVSGVATLVAAGAIGFPLHGLWSVLTAVVVTQISVGGSLGATIDYLIGTLCGAVYAAAVGLIIPHTTLLGEVGALALATIPLSLAAAINPSFRVAPFSAVLVLLIGTDLGMSPINSALTRVLEVALGGAIAVLVSLLVLPERARVMGMEAASRALDQMADILPKILDGFARRSDPEEIGRLQESLREAVVAFQGLSDEVRRERLLSLAHAPDPGPLARTLRRLRHDLGILARASSTPLPDGPAAQLRDCLAGIAALGAAFLRGSGSAHVERGAPPPLAPLDAALSAYEAEVTSLRAEGLTRSLSTADVERLFALGFALDEMRGDLADLARCVQEYVRPEAPKIAEPSAAD